MLSSPCWDSKTKSCVEQNDTEKYQESPSGLVITAPTSRLWQKLTLFMPGGTSPPEESWDRAVGVKSVGLGCVGENQTAPDTSMWVPSSPCQGASAFLSNQSCPVWTAGRAGHFCFLFSWVVFDTEPFLKVNYSREHCTRGSRVFWSARQTTFCMVKYNTEYWRPSGPQWSSINRASLHSWKHH